MGNFPSRVISFLIFMKTTDYKDLNIVDLHFTYNTTYQLPRQVAKKLVTIRSVFSIGQIPRAKAVFKTGGVRRGGLT